MCEKLEKHDWWIRWGALETDEWYAVETAALWIKIDSITTVHLFYCVQGILIMDPVGHLSWYLEQKIWKMDQHLQWPVLNESKDREWKDKDAVGKITGSGTGNTYMGRLNIDRSTGDRNSCHYQDVTVASYDPIVQNTSIHGLQKSSSDGSISLTGSRTLTGPVAVSVSSSGTEKLI